jgi:hypothetical protein
MLSVRVPCSPRFGRRTCVTCAPLALLAAVLCSAPAHAQSETPPPAATPAAAQDAPANQVEQLRRELDELKRQYDERIAALEKRLAEISGNASTSTPATGAGETAPPAPTPAETPPPGDTTAAAPPAEVPAPPATPPPVSAASSSKVFNPDMAVIGNMLGAVGRNTIESSDALSLAETEASFQAIVDPYARADFFISFAPEGVDVEEGFLTFTSLPAGLLVKVGKMRGQFGKANTMHSHTMPWVDRPLVTRDLVGGDDGISQPGFSVSKLLPNKLLFLEATGEVYGGSSDVFHSSERSQLTYIGRVHGYRDLTEGTNLDLGTSIAYGHTDLEPDATRQLVGIDAAFRWRPLRRAIYRRFIARSELIWGSDRLTARRPTSFGTYLSGEYQFAQRWYAGARFDYSERAANPLLHDKGGAALLTFWPSEFSQIRGEYRRTSYAEGTTANELLFQFLFAIGAHGAHTF